jgi:antitoxin FitA
MSKMIQVRNVPDKLHRELSRRARKKHQTLTAYIQELLEREVAHPMLEEVIERIHKRTPVKLSQSVAEIIREEREARDRELYRRSLGPDKTVDNVAEDGPGWQAD